MFCRNEPDQEYEDATQEYEDALYAQVADELARKEIHSGLMAKAIDQAMGDQELAKSLYIRFRVQELDRQTRRQTDPPSRESRKYAENKNPVFAMILSLVIVGLGQFYNGDNKKGAIMLLAGIVLGLLTATVLWWVMAIWTAVDAYRVAARKAPMW